jgi:predicted nucleic-acid-binding protein
MIGIDTNVLIRYLAEDDPLQTRLAVELIEETISSEEPAFISLIVLIEVIRVFKVCYKRNKTDLCKLVRGILETKQFKVEQADLAYNALKLYESGNGDFSDALISSICKENQCMEIFTFDKKAKTVGMTLLQ